MDLGRYEGNLNFYVHAQNILEDDGKPLMDAQRRLNPTMKEVVRKEVLKWLDVGVIYPIYDSSWESHV